MNIKLSLTFEGNTITLKAFTDEIPISTKDGPVYRNLDRRCIELHSIATTLFDADDSTLADAVKEKIKDFKAGVLAGREVLKELDEEGRIRSLNTEQRLVDREFDKLYEDSEESKSE